MTSDQPGSTARSGARNEFGELLPVRPATGKPSACLRGHRLDLGLYEKLAPYSHRYRLHATLCEVCRALEACDPSERRLAEWAHLDIASQRTTAAAVGDGLVIVVRSPAPGTLAGQVALHLDGSQVASATLSICVPCQVATLDYVHVVASYRRLGYGRTLVAAAVTRAPSYRWTAPLPDGPVAQSFRARIAMRRAGSPCIHRGGDEAGR
ncbi:GNAT family N-acetyltransferase [Amycolatopsis sp. NPDC048633]|uniref:GNAT family N-acetyltransferase n=1 Tax=Amycolatopsis sp. NPDC048633 TaxID=3157095 RepID=UPI0033F64234